MHPFDQATALERAGENLWRGATDDGYWAFVGPFGGFLAAVLLRAVMQDERRLGEPIALTVNFCGPVAQGPFEIKAHPARTNRSTQHWSMTLLQGGETMMTATAVTAERRPSWSHGPMRMPAAPPADAVPPAKAPPGTPRFVNQYEFRFVKGFLRPGGTREAPLDPLSHLWMRDAVARPLDVVSLASLADAFFGRIFLSLGGVVPFGTVSLTTYFLGAADEIARQGDAPILGVADAKRFSRSYSDQTAELWASDGTLLATSVQVCYFKA